jgi:hypothetical protein
MSGRHWRRARIEKPDLVMGGAPVPFALFGQIADAPRLVLSGYITTPNPNLRKFQYIRGIYRQNG